MPAALDKKYLEQRPAHKGRWYVVRDVPADVRGVLGKRLVKALGTHDLRKARAMRHAVLADFERQIADARKPGADAVTREALEYRHDLQRLDAGDGSVISIAYEGGEVRDIREKKEWAHLLIEDRASELAGIASWDGRDGAEPGRLAGAEKFHGIASGTATPILLHLDTFLAQGNRRKVPSVATVQGYRANATLLAGMLATYGCTTIEAVSRALAGRVVNEMAARGDNPGTIHNRVAAMSSFWRWLQRRGFADDTVRNVWHEQGVAQSAPPDKRPFTDAELLALLAGPAGQHPDPERHDVMRILALSGMRVHELYNLRVRDCRDGWFDIRASKTQAGVRRVPIHSAVAGLVETRRAGKEPDAFLIHEAGPASVRRSGAFVKDFERYRRTCGVHQTTEGRQSAVTLHTFRAWFASAIRPEHDAGVAATLLGHAQRGTTDQSYTKFAAERLIAAVEAVRLPTIGL
jgi:integrase